MGETPLKLLFFWGDWEHLMTFPLFQSQNSSHGNQIQQLMQLLTLPLGSQEFTKKKNQPTNQPNPPTLLTPHFSNHHRSGDHICQQCLTCRTTLWGHSETKLSIHRTCRSFLNFHCQLLCQSHRILLLFLSSRNILLPPSYQHWYNWAYIQAKPLPGGRNTTSELTNFHWRKKSTWSQRKGLLNHWLISGRTHIMQNTEWRITLMAPGKCKQNHIFSKIFN